MKSLFALLVLGSLLSFSPHSFAQSPHDRLRKATCEQFLKDFRAPLPTPPTPAPVPSWFSALRKALFGDQQAFAERKVLQAQRREYDLQNAALRQSERNRDEAIERGLAKITQLRHTLLAPDQLDPALYSTAEIFAPKAALIIERAQHPDDVKDILEFFSQIAIEIRDLSDQLKTAKKEALKKIKRQVRQSESVRGHDQVEARLQEAQQEIREGLSVEEVAQLTHSKELEIMDLQLKIAHAERDRRMREKRFDPNLVESLPQIFETLGSLAPSVDISALKVPLQESLGLRQFFLHELQMLRRLGGEAAQAELVKIRLQNDFAVLDHPVSTIEGLRLALLRLQGAEIRRLSLLEREKLLAAVLANEELRASLLVASEELPTAPQVPVPPEMPSLPKVPNIPKKVNSRRAANKVKREIQQYKDEVEAYKQAREVYLQKAAHFRDHVVPRYRQEAQVFHEARARRTFARRSFLSYLAKTAPEIFRTPQDPAAIQANFEKALQDLSATDPELHRQIERHTSRAPRRISSSRSSSEDDFFFWWLLYYNLWSSNSPHLYTSSTVSFDLDRVFPSDIKFEETPLQEKDSVNFAGPDIEMPSLEDLPIEAPEAPQFESSFGSDSDGGSSDSGGGSSDSGGSSSDSGSSSSSFD